MSAVSHVASTAGPVDYHQAGQYGVVPGKPHCLKHDRLELPSVPTLVDSKKSVMRCLN